jgi:HAD superfamily hydrolase (TIGR01509 family)
MSARPALVIFDCDGVLVDSERIGHGTLAAMATESGYPLTVDDSFRLFMGWRMPDVIAHIEAGLGRPLPAGWLEEFSRRRDAVLERELKPVAGIAAVLDALAAAEIATCVASSGSLRKMRFTLGLTGLDRAFGDRLYSTWDLPRGKPFPDVFLHAAASLGFAPAESVVIEDSPAGAEAARAAGMRCFGYAADSDRAALQAHGATVFFAMDALPALLGLPGRA